MSRIVVDCSMSCSWLFADENDPSTDTVLLQVGTHGAYAPSIWWIETRNVLITSERRRRITRADTNWSLSLLSQLDVRLDSQPVEATLLALARRHSLTIYDALYLELSTRLAAPLATLDRALIRAAELEQVTLAN